MEKYVGKVVVAITDKDADIEYYIAGGDKITKELSQARVFHSAKLAWFKVFKYYYNKRDRVLLLPVQTVQVGRPLVPLNKEILAETIDWYVDKSHKTSP